MFSRNGRRVSLATSVIRAKSGKLTRCSAGVILRLFGSGVSKVNHPRNKVSVGTAF